MSLKRIRELNWDTIAEKFIVRDQSGKKIEVPLGVDIDRTLAKEIETSLLAVDATYGGTQWQPFADGYDDSIFELLPIRTESANATPIRLKKPGLYFVSLNWADIDATNEAVAVMTHAGIEFNYNAIPFGGTCPRNGVATFFLLHAEEWPTSMFTFQLYFPQTRPGFTVGSIDLKVRALSTNNLS